MTDEHRREDVAGAGEVDRYLGVVEQEIFVVGVVVAGHAMAAFDGYGGDEHRLGADGPQLVEQFMGLLVGDALGVERMAGEVAGLGVVGVDEVGHGHHLAHALDGGGCDAVVELTFVAHDGVNEDGGAAHCLLAAVLRDEPRLAL